MSERDAAKADRDAVVGHWTHFLGLLQGNFGTELKADPVPFQCNVCGALNLVPRNQIGREVSSCGICGSTVRWRAIVHLLSLALYGRSIPLPDFPVTESVCGAGLSDWSGYADRLATKFSYRNTYFHQEPMLDILHPPRSMFATLDFLISTEVFEHVPAPVSKAFEGAFELLRPGGYLILTVPYTLDAETVEHYPDIEDFSVIQLAGQYCVVARKRDGAFIFDTEPKFHGGPGQTLEMRVFCEREIMDELSNAGFVDIQVVSESLPAFGLYFRESWALPILARKPV